MASFPLAMVYIIYPILSAVLNIFDIVAINYELINIIILLPFVVIGLINHIKINKYISETLIICLFLILLKYVLPSIYEVNVVWRALFIDVKWLIYLVLALLWVGLFGKIDFYKIYYYGKIYAIIYIVYVIIMTIKSGNFSRENSGLLSECNYDCFLLLIPFCFYYTRPRKSFDFILFLVAILFSTSKTGFVTFFAIICYRMFKNSKFKLFIILLFNGLIVFWLYIFFINKGITEVDEVDRVIYFLQFFDYISQSSLSNSLFGIFPGKAMDINPMPAFEWTIHKFETMNKIVGCFPFIFHSTYMRLGIVWGIPFVIFIIAKLLHLFFVTTIEPLKYLLIVFFLESISLSTLSLENISFVYFICIISVFWVHCNVSLKCTK